MRDLVLAALIFSALPVVLFRPFFGVIFWTWLAYFNPQKSAYSFARQIPFSEIVGGVTLAAWLFSREPKSIPLSRTTILWISFIAWTFLTTLFAELQDPAHDLLLRFVSVQVFAILAIIVTNTWERLRALIWVSVVSLGFYGVKGGAYVIATGGSSGKVWGPTGTFIEGNNELALALILILPLALYLYRTSVRKVERVGLAVSMILISFSIAGSFSRGAILAAGALLFFLAWRSKQRIRFTLFAVLTVGGIFVTMPSSWFERAETIKTYQEDGSAQKRLNTWTFAWRYALDHPVMGGGFRIFWSDEAYASYAPRHEEGWSALDAHSIYFQVLAEHGFIGLALFLATGLSAWFDMRRVLRERARKKWRDPDPGFVALATLLQASLLAFSVGGAFLSLAYFDLPYAILGMSVVLSTHLWRREKESLITPATRTVPLQSRIAEATSKA